MRAARSRAACGLALVLLAGVSRAGPAVGAPAPPPEVLARAEADAGLAPRLPSWLPEGAAYEGFEVVPHGRRKLAHHRYRVDGAVLSFFQCPPRTRLDFGSAERRGVRVGGRKGQFMETERGGVLVWSAHGMRFALIGRLPLELLRRIAESVR